MAGSLKVGDHIACFKPGDIMIDRVESVREDGTVQLGSFKGAWMSHGDQVTVVIPGAGTFQRIDPEEVDALAELIVDNRMIAEHAQVILRADPRDLPAQTITELNRIVVEHDRLRANRLRKTG